MELRLLENLSQVDPAQWDALCGSAPTLRHAFLQGLEESGAVSSRTGWAPCHVTLWEGSRLEGAIPAYVKTHSWGEYVFDWAWAEAYQRAGLAYYPKILAAVPFTPVPGSRILSHDPASRSALVLGLETARQQAGASSIHVLFADDRDGDDLSQAGFKSREGLQFHWCNDHYADFDAFLATFNHDKRKKIKQERRRLHETGMYFEWKTGECIRPDDWLFFEECYRHTYLQHGAHPYLDGRFFRMLGERMAGQALLIMAMRNGNPVGCALNLIGEDRLHGRYWGAVEYWPGLHFETCYYQSIEYCIRHGLRFFEGGAQGEHKLARGLLPVRTQSWHKLANSVFSGAVARFLEKETRGVEHYRNELLEHGPFRKNGQS